MCVFFLTSSSHRHHLNALVIGSNGVVVTVTILDSRAELPRFVRLSVVPTLLSLSTIAPASSFAREKSFDCMASRFARMPIQESKIVMLSAAYGLVSSIIGGQSFFSIRQIYRPSLLAVRRGNDT